MDTCYYIRVRMLLFVSACYYICVCILIYMCPQHLHDTIHVSTYCTTYPQARALCALPQRRRCYYNLCVVMLLYMWYLSAIADTTICLSSCSVTIYVCPHVTTYVYAYAQADGDADCTISVPVRLCVMRYLMTRCGFKERETILIDRCVYWHSNI